MQTKFDENVLGYWKLPNGNDFVKLKIDDGFYDNWDNKKCPVIWELLFQVIVSEL